MLKLLLKIWPALLPITIYVLWTFLKRKSCKKDYIDADYKIVRESSKMAEKSQENSSSKKLITPFSLENKAFVAILFITLILIIFSLIFIIISNKPLKYEDVQLQQKMQQQKIIIE